MLDCHRELSRWLSPLGIVPTIDAAGNLRAVYPGTEANAPRLLIGSHLDTVPNAGPYDGVLGVVLAVSLLEALQGRRLPFAIELVAFSEEEGVRFGVPFIGSRALVGRLDESLLNRCDPQGVSIREAIISFGLDPADISKAVVQNDVLGYVEFHIEQGPLLEAVDRSLAAVDSIVGQGRMEFIFEGGANHAGTTPMNLRRDALIGAAEWVCAVEACAQRIPDLVATVGAIQAFPGIGNVIAREARLSLDVRHRNDPDRLAAVQELTHRAEEIARRRKLTVRRLLLMDQPTVLMDPFLVTQIDEAIKQSGCEAFRMASGAGHDAMIMAEKVPSAMVFLRTPGGVSHDPTETVDVGDVARAIDCGMHLLDQLASSSEFLSRTNRA
jgi:allantoate deiminase